MNKAAFVEKEIYFLLCAANDNVADTAYCEECGEEWVLVTMKNGCEYEISITGDSLMAIAKDVTNFMMYR